MYALTDYHYDLPAELIAQDPLPSRDQSRLMVLTRSNRAVGHAGFSDLEQWLRPGDLLVVNDTQVIPGRLVGRKDTGGKIEFLILDYPGEKRPDRTAPGADGLKEIRFQCLTRASKPLRPGTVVRFSRGLEATVLDGEKGLYTVSFTYAGRFDDVLEQWGQVPLPPYIKRNGDREVVCDDRNAYQTVYAKQKGAVAAPTAGLHFSKELLSVLKKKGVEVVSLTLHVGYGTFLPVRVKDIRDHQIHSERFHLGEETASAIDRAKAEGRRAIAVGTTAVRVLEYCGQGGGQVQPGSGDCDLYIYPGFRFHIVDGLITNFHLPESTLLMLVSAFAGREFILAAYKEAIKRQYRFFSYGDAMFIS